MTDLKKVTGIVRTDCIPELARALDRTEVTRFYLSRVHAVGSGVDPEDFRVSLDDGSVYTEKSRIEFLCRAESTDELVELIREWARTGHRGDGVVVVTDVLDVVNVRTGDRDVAALL